MDAFTVSISALALAICCSVKFCLFLFCSNSFCFCCNSFFKSETVLACTGGTNVGIKKTMIVVIANIFLNTLISLLL